jgi:hypothetical protein
LLTATATATATACSFTQCVALLQPGKTLAAEELNRWRQHALLARNTEFLRNYSDPFFDDIIDERLDSLQFPAIRVKCVTSAPAVACTRPPTCGVRSCLRRSSRTAALGRAHVGAGTRLHLRRDRATSALGLAHICAGIVPHLRRDWLRHSCGTSQPTKLAQHGPKGCVATCRTTLQYVALRCAK